MIVGPGIFLTADRVRRLHPELLMLVHRAGATAAPTALALVDELTELLRAVDAANGDRALNASAEIALDVVDVKTAARRLGLACRTVTGHCNTGRLTGWKVNGRWLVQLD